MSNFTLKAEKRQDLGKGASRRLRRTNQTPAIIYGGEAEPISITLSHFELIKNLKDDSFYSQIVNIDVAGEVVETVLRDLQRHPYKAIILHADFQRVVRGQEIHVHVPIHVLNTDKAVGVKAGGLLSQHVIEVEVSCRPRLLPAVIEVDAMKLAIGDVLKLSEIKLPEGVSIPALSHGEGADVPVVSIHAPKGGATAEGDAETEASE